MSSSTHKPAHKPTPDQRLAAANILAQRRLQGISGERLPVSLRPDSIEEAMHIQGLLAGQLDDTIAGWKCGMPSDGKIVVIGRGFTDADLRRSLRAFAEASSPIRGNAELA